MREHVNETAKNMERIDLINNEDVDERKPRWWIFRYLGNQMAMSYAKGTLKQIKDSTYLANTLVAEELTKDDYEERIKNI